MQTSQEIKSFIYDKLLERGKVMREANELVDTISNTANIEVDKINIEIQTAQELLANLEGAGENQEEE